MGNGGSRSGFSGERTWPTLSFRDCQISATWLVYPCTFYGSIYMSFKNKVILWNWLNADMGTRFVDMASAYALFKDANPVSEDFEIGLHYI